MNRRAFLLSTLVPAAAAPRRARAAADRHPPRILLRSSWQTVNIGDIGHTPGVLALLERFLPEADVLLWPSRIDNGVDAMLRRRFPRLGFVQTPEEIRAAFDRCDFLLHGSGPSLVAQRDVARWHRETRKPFGVYGITLGAAPPETAELLGAARFALFRDSVSLGLARESGVRSPVMEFCPDGAFAVDLRDEARAQRFLAGAGLEPGGFLCCLSRLRHTPYWKVKPGVAFDPVKQARNEERKERDHAPLRDAIAAVTRETPFRVLLCPEDATQMAVGRELLYDPLPADVRRRVVWRESYWLTDEALSTYIRSAGLFGSEMHSPIMALGNGVPAIVCRFAEQTSKGIMWRDIGLGDWLFDLDREEEIPRVAPAVLAMAKDPAAAREKAAAALGFVRRRQRETMALLRRTLGI